MLTLSMKLPQMAGTGRRSRQKRVGMPNLPRAERRNWWDNLVIVFPFNSVWEVALDILLRQRDPNWIAQVQFGEYGQEGSTRPDWIHPIKKLAFYLDTPVHHIFRLEARDAYLRSGLESEGWDVLVWDVPTLEYAVVNFHRWYRAVVEGNGYWGAGV